MTAAMPAAAAAAAAVAAVATTATTATAATATATPTTTLAAIALTAILGALALFELALVLGAPLGEFAWGGADRVLPRRKRIGSAVSILVYALIGWIILARAGAAPAPIPQPAVAIAAWIVTAYFALGILMNALSRSRKERFTMTPVAALLAVLSLIVALG
ncbi:hypothetical protein AB2L57_04150 [Microbacterium sp. HA-8]|uniref:hypothetical protein n=1 Tax=Microbacterium sp. HA-8 TaxID=3234200 RepID=UPI0038F6CD54